MVMDVRDTQIHKVHRTQIVKVYLFPYKLWKSNLEKVWKKKKKNKLKTFYSVYNFVELNTSI